MTRRAGQGRKVHHVTDEQATQTACQRHVDSPDVRALTSDPAEVTCGGCREALHLDDHAAVLAAVEATLRYVTAWAYDAVTADGVGPSVLCEDLENTAASLAAYAGDLSDATACPVCEEVRCDDDCPLYPVRADLGLWSAP